MKQKRESVEITRNTAKRSFLMLEPKELCNADEVARAIALCKGVEEVHLTSGRYGFIITTKTSSEYAVKNIGSAAMRVAGSRALGIAMGHTVYKKG